MTEAPKSMLRAWLEREKQRMDEKYKELSKADPIAADLWYKQQQIEIVNRAYDMDRRAQGFD